MSQTSDRASVLRQVAQSIEELADRPQQSNLSAATGILAGLVLDKQVIRRVLRRELMQESVIYQELREEAREEARQELLNEIREEVRLEERLEGERSLILRLLARKVGELPDSVRSHIELLAIAQLEALGEALLDFSSLVNLEDWLAEQRQ